MIGQNGRPNEPHPDPGPCCTHRYAVGDRAGRARVMESGDAAVAQKAMPAVVNISTWKVKQPEKEGDSPRRVKTYGSGFIIDPSGIIVTNKHVIDGAIDIKVIFENGDRVPGKLLAVAAMADLAVVKVDAGRPLPALQWGDSKSLHVGDPVLTIGNPLGLGMSVSSGIVSALNRDIQDTPFDDYIQTDSAINHGNSGGPMVDLDGEVIGVDTALYNPEQSGGFIGIGFAIPARHIEVRRRPSARSQPSQAWLAWPHASGRDDRTRGGVGPARREGLDHLRGGRGRTGEHGGAAARRYPDGDQRSPSPRTPGLHAHDRADSGRAAGAVDGLAGWQGATRHRNGRPDGQTTCRAAV